MPLKIPLVKAPSEKISISFTWDDNSERHITMISPLFLENGFRCTFYVVPGDREFDSFYSSSYAELATFGFEIGSHSFTHQYMTSLTKQQSTDEFIEAIKKICDCVAQYPITFAFPNHDYNEDLIEQARNYHLETRNTLANSIRFSLKTNTSLKDIINAIDEAIMNNVSLIFSGHSIITEEEILKGQSGEGYQPIRITLLSDVLLYLKKVASKVDVLTFLQSSLKTLINLSC